jgi:hypothetical protein
MSRADDLYADHDPNAAGAALNERDDALAEVEALKDEIRRLKTWRDLWTAAALAATGEAGGTA